MRYKIKFNFHYQARLDIPTKRKWHESPGYTKRKRHQFQLRASSRPAPILVAGLFVLATCVGGSAPTAAAGCDDVKFIFARGSGEKLGDVSFAAWRDSLNNVLKKSTLRYSFYELGTYVQGGYRYPAVSVDGFGRLLGTYAGAGRAFAFGESVMQGSNELKNYISLMSSACPNMRFVLGGYSQGAMLTTRTLWELNPNRILYVATFGDPKLYLPEGKGIIPPACLGKSYSPYRKHVPDCRAYEGILGSYRPYQPAGYDDKLGTWCNAKDIMCSSGSNVDDHVAYTSNGLYASAAREIKTRLRRAFPTAFASMSASPWVSAAHNVAFLFDTTVSMAKYIDEQLRYADQLATKIVTHGGKVAVVSFTDLDDYYYPDPLTRCDFSCSEDELHAVLQHMPTGGGGDDPESGLSAMLYAMNNLDWQDGATKSIVVITDNAYLSPDRDGTTLNQVVQRSLELDPVNVYALTPRNFQSAYADLVAQTNGSAFNFDDNDYWGQIADQLLYRPEAILNAPEFSGVIGDEFYFDASASAASDGGNLRYDWDLDGDGIFELQSGPAQLAQTYAQPLSGFIQVKATDASGRYSTMSAKITVLAAAPSLPTISQATAREISTETYEIQYSTDAERLLVSVDEAPIGYVDGAAHRFTLADIKPSTSLRLTPYTSSIGRGEGITLTLDPGASAPTAPDATTIPKAPNAGINVVEERRKAASIPSEALKERRSSARRTRHP